MVDTPKTSIDETTAAPEAQLVPVVKKKEMIARVAESSGIKRSDAKKVLEATLKELGDALQSGEELNLPPLGKLSVTRQREGTGAHILITKLRRPKAMMASAVPSASADIAPEDADDGHDS